MPTAKKLPSGSWRCQVFSHYEYVQLPDGTTKKKRIYESFTCDDPSRAGKRKAEAMAAQFAEDKERKTRPQNYTILEAFEKYIETKSNVLSETTLRGYETIKNNHIDFIKDCSIRNISNDTVQAWINTLSSSKSPKTVRNAYGLFKAVMALFCPSVHFSVTLPESRKFEGYTPSDEDIIKLIKHIEGTELEKAVLLSAFGALRRGEVCGLTKEDIDGNKITIRNTRVRGRKGIIEKSPKNQTSQRTVTYPEFVIRKFDDIEGRLVKMHPEDISKKFGRILDEACIRRFRFHDLRHYTASIMHAIGVPDQYILQRGGWKTDHVMKSVYRNLIDAESQKFIDITNAHFDAMQHDLQHIK